MITTTSTAAIRPIQRSSRVTSGANRNVSNAASASGMRISRAKYNNPITNEVSRTAAMTPRAFALELLVCGIGMGREMLDQSCEGLRRNGIAREQPFGFLAIGFARVVCDLVTPGAFTDRASPVHFRPAT